MNKRKLGKSSPLGTWAERAYPKLIRFNKLDKSRHFAAWEQPELSTQQLPTAFMALR
jgi:hypothetical protein